MLHPQLARSFMFVATLGFSGILGACGGDEYLNYGNPDGGSGGGAGTSGLPCDVAQVLSAHCLSCHGDTRPKADLSLTKYTTAEAILKDRKVWQRVQEVIHGGEMPPEPRPKPGPGESDAFLKSVAGIFDHHDRTAPPDPGRVTMRRLNRLEYNNTIRDLTGVDFTPADDFPSDDVGHGFDNIGDVLTLPPVLLERYLAAAESVMDRAILVTPPPVPKRYLSARFLQPGSNEITEKTGRFRRMNPADADPKLSGPFFAPADYLKLSDKDDIIVRANLYAVPKGPSPVKVALILDGGKLADPSPAAEVEKLFGAGGKAAGPVKVLQVFEITARDEKKTQQIEFRLNKRGDAQRAGVAVVRPPAGEEPPQVYVEHIWSEGPLETRPRSHQMLLACDESKPAAEKTREVLARFASRAYRRPVAPDEVQRLLRLYDAATTRGDAWDQAIRLPMKAVLCSPHFLYRIEDDPENPDAVRTLNDFEFATRLSYFLWSSMPDEELFRHATAGDLRRPEVLQAQVLRMTRDPKAKALSENFAGQWLQLRSIRTLSPDKDFFPRWDEPLRAGMIGEAEAFFEYVVQNDRSALEFLDADYTFVNQRMAEHYGIPNVFGKAFRRVTLPDARRGGIITMASTLTVTSNPTRTSPVKRGKWILENILGTPPPPPAPDVPELPPTPQLKGTLRQQMEQHRENPTCAACHARLDPLGFGLENFDGIGTWRDQDNKQKVDASGVLPDGSKFTGPAELRKVLVGKGDLFRRCLSEKLLTFALGRGLEYYDKCALDDIVAAARRSEDRFSAYVLAVVTSDPFQKRKGKRSE